MHCSQGLKIANHARSLELPLNSRRHDDVEHCFPNARLPIRYKHRIWMMNPKEETCFPDKTFFADLQLL